MFKKIFLALIFLFLGAATGAWIFEGVEKSVSRAEPAQTTWKNQPSPQVPLPARPQAPAEIKRVSFNEPQESEVLILPKHAFQTFNNCGPTTLSMMLAYYDVNKTPAELGKLIRPYQNQGGG
jgi:hypothetical protein